jgi:hypothetical protein
VRNYFVTVIDDYNDCGSNYDSEDNGNCFAEESSMILVILLTIGSAHRLVFLTPITGVLYSLDVTLITLVTALAGQCFLPVIKVPSPAISLPANSIIRASSATGGTNNKVIII